jgi:hypothetical protein
MTKTSEHYQHASSVKPNEKKRLADNDRPTDEAIPSKKHQRDHRDQAHEDPLETLVKWAISNGAEVSNISLSNLTSNDGDETDTKLRGAIAAADIPAGGVIGYLPEKLVLSESTARSSDIGWAITNYFINHPEEANTLGGGTDPYAQGLILLAAYLAHEHFALPKGQSFWSPYLSSLPDKFDLPLEWPEKDISDLLRGTNLAFIVRERRRLLSDAVELVHKACKESNIVWGAKSEKPGKCDLTMEQLIWAYSAIASRAFPKPISVSDQQEESKTSESQELSENEKKEIAASNAILNSTARVSELCLYPVLDMVGLFHNPYHKPPITIMH